MDNSLLGSKIQLLGKSLDAGMLRSKIIANNIANSTTPGFNRAEVTFEGELRKALQKESLKGTRTDEMHMATGKKELADIKPDAYQPADNANNSGAPNNVDIEMEMAKLVENQMLYQYTAKFAAGTYKKANSAIKGRAAEE